MRITKISDRKAKTPKGQFEDGKYPGSAQDTSTNKLLGCHYTVSNPHQGGVWEQDGIFRTK